MNHEETNLTGGEDEVLLPVETAVTDSEKAQQPKIEIPIGHVLITALDSNGSEIPGSEFFYSERSYQRFYADETKFSVKKKTLTTYNSFYHETLNRTSQQITQRITGRCGSCGR